MTHRELIDTIAAALRPKGFRIEDVKDRAVLVQWEDQEFMVGVSEVRKGPVRGRSKQASH